MYCNNVNMASTRQFANMSQADLAEAIEGTARIFASGPSRAGKEVAECFRDYARGLRYVPREESTRCMQLGHAVRYYEKHFPDDLRSFSDAT